MNCDPPAPVFRQAFAPTCFFCDQIENRAVSRCIDKQVMAEFVWIRACGNGEFIDKRLGEKAMQ